MERLDRIVASLAAYFAGEFSNSYVMAKRHPPASATCWNSGRPSDSSTCFGSRSCRSRSCSLIAPHLPVCRSGHHRTEKGGRLSRGSENRPPRWPDNGEVCCAGRDLARHHRDADADSDGRHDDTFLWCETLLDRRALHPAVRNLRWLGVYHPLRSHRAAAGACVSFPAGRDDRVGLGHRP